MERKAKSGSTLTSEGRKQQPIENKENKSAKIQVDDMEYINELQSAILVQKTPMTLIILWVIVALITISLFWAHFAIVEEITVGEGKIIPASREQVIQSLEGGLLEEMNVHEGQIVEKGQVLLRIDPTRSNASYLEALSKVQGLKATIARLRAEAYETPLKFPDEIKNLTSIIDDETQAYYSRQKTLNETVESLKHSLDLAENEVNLSQPLARRGLVSEVEILRLRRQANEFRLQIAERKNRFRSEANNDLTKLESELAQSMQILSGRQDVVERTTIVAPVKGTVNNIKVTTHGGVIQQGSEIMTIIPLEDKLLVEAKIKPSDVAFLHPGQPALVKITAYDYAIYGGLEGQVEHISPDTIYDEEKARAGKADANYYRVYIRTNRAELKVGKKFFPIIPGMVATVEIRTGQKTVLSYLLKPVLKAREAFRER